MVPPPPSPAVPGPTPDGASVEVRDATPAATRAAPAAALVTGGRGWVRWVPLLLPWTVFVVLGLRGLDFGKHWDEGLQRYQVGRAVGDRDLLPGQYKYPSLIVHLSLVAATPDWTDAWGAPENSEARVALDHRMREGPWLRRARTLCLLFTSLALVGVYGALLAATGRVLPAWAGASALGASWELGYHARWLAPDGLVVAAGALVLWAAAAHLRRRAEGGTGRASLLACAAAVGLAAGSKYTGGAWLLVPLGLALGPLVSRRWSRVGRSGRVGAAGGAGASPDDATVGLADRARAARTNVLSVVGLATAVFLLITPGAVLEREEFLRDLAYERAHYTTGHYGHTVLPGLEHARLAFGYLLRHVGSALPGVQALGVGLAALGLLASLLPRTEGGPRGRRPLAALAALTVAAYVVYVTGLRVMFVRNLLLVLPALALAVGLGVQVLQGGLAGAPGRASGARRVVATAALALVLGTAWAASVEDQLRAADTIAADSPEARALALDRWIDAHPGARVYLTRELREQRAAAGLPPRPEVADSDPEACDYVALVTGERRLRGRWAHRPDPGEPEHNQDWPSNRPGWAEAVFGPREVHWAYYTSWLEPHTVVLDRAAHAELMAYSWRDLLPEDHRRRGAAGR